MDREAPPKLPLNVVGHLNFRKVDTDISFERWSAGIVRFWKTRKVGCEGNHGRQTTSKTFLFPK